MNKLGLAILVSLVGHVLAWFHMQGQFRWEWAKTRWWIILGGIPISYLFWYCTKWGYVGFGNLWSVRFMGFAASMLTFPIMTWLYLGEVIGLKTIISLALAIVIMLLQLI